MKKYLITPRASKDLNEIHDYMAKNSVSRAANFIDLIEDDCKIISESPMIGRARDELFPGIRSFSVGDYIIFYRVVNLGIEIIRVLHGSRDIFRIFKKDEGISKCTS